MSRKFLFVVLAIIGIFLTLQINGALASDVPSDTDACKQFPHNWGANISCVGKFEMADMGAYDENGVWQWDSAFQTLLNSNFSAWDQASPTAWDEMAFYPNTEIVIGNGRLDNKRFPNAEPKHRFAGVGGYINGTMIPSV